MAIIWCSRLTILLVLLTTIYFSLIAASTLAGDHEVVVDMESSLPSQSKEPLKLGCGKPWIHLKTGDHYTLKLKPHEALECSAQWLPYFTTWDAYNAKTDLRHLRFNNTIFWRIAKDGFYRSWDHGSTWKKIVGWYTE